MEKVNGMISAPTKWKVLAQSALPESFRLWRRQPRVRVYRPGRVEPPAVLSLQYAQRASFLRAAMPASLVQVRARAKSAPLATSHQVSEQQTVQRAHPGCIPVAAPPIVLAGRAWLAGSAQPALSRRICASRAQWENSWNWMGRRDANRVPLADFLPRRVLRVARPALLANLPFPVAPRNAARVHQDVSSQRVRSRSHARRARKARVIRTADELATSACPPVSLASASPLLSASLFACWRS